LLAHPRERRAMLEDALGLKAFEFRKQDAERKLEKTDANVREVESLRREIAPHVRFLKKQVERIERAESLIEELAVTCQTYFAIEEKYLEVEQAGAAQERTVSAEKLAHATKALADFDERTTHDTEGMKLAQRIRDAEREVDRATTERSALGRELGRIEGALEGAKRRGRTIQQANDVRITREDLQALQDFAQEHAALDDHANPAALLAALRSLRAAISAFFTKHVHAGEDILQDEEQLVHSLTREQEIALAKDAELATRIDEARTALMKAREASMAHDETGREERHHVLQLAEEKAREEAALVRLDARLQELSYLNTSLERERAEALALAGSRALSYEPLTMLPQESRHQQEERKRILERLKIRVEEAGGGSDEVKKEYEEAVAREAFLTRELEDLAKSSLGLRELIEELDGELTRTFNEGLISVNSSFGEFFSLMFGGGGAKLVLEDVTPLVSESDDEDVFDVEEGDEVLTRQKRYKPGIDISVHLPKKRVQSLLQLSGGERALTSIALIFAMSQVNPPPFLILDETDAALDEANSRRYGDMIESLAKKSQLIVISHNRETMSRARGDVRGGKQK
jgi:chromosome segregation protein